VLAAQTITGAMFAGKGLNGFLKEIGNI